MRAISAGNSIFTDVVAVRHRQTGCVRYCYLPLASAVPRRFRCHPVDEAAAASGLGPRWSELRANWESQMAEVLAEADLPVPAASKFLSTGKRGVHSEHMGYILAEMQHLQRAYPGGVW